MTSLKPFSFLIGGMTVFAASAAAQTSTEQTVTPEPEARKNSVQVGTGFDYSRGAYGFAEDTEVFSVPLTLTYNVEKWILRASVPFLKIEGPADAVGSTGAGGAGGGGGGGGGGGATGGLGGIVPGLPGSSSSSSSSSNFSNSSSVPNRASSSSESGMGDILVGATRMLGPVLGPVQVDLTARVKIPTADDAKGLGTGEMDYYAQADFYHVGERFIPFATLGYRVLTDSDRYELENGVYASAGSAYRLNDSTRVGASLDWRQRIVDNGDDATEVSAFVAHDFNARWNMVFYALTGLTDASADFGAGGSVTYRF